MATMLRVIFVLASLAALGVEANDRPTGDLARDFVRDRDAEIYRELQLRNDAGVREALKQRIEAAEGKEVAAKIARLDISPADLAWAFSAEQIYSDGVSAGDVTAGEFLDDPDLQLDFKLAADVLAAPYSGRKSLVPSSAEYEDALFASFASDLAPLAHMREAGAGVEDLLWLHAVQRFDQALLADDETTADDLFSMPRYWLARKIMADTVAASMAHRVRCSDPNAAYYVAELCGRGWCDTKLGMNRRTCDIGRAVCELAPFPNCARAFDHCFCVANCASRHCDAGAMLQICYSDCGDVEGDG